MSLKLITKENLLPSSSNKFLFIFAPMLNLILSLIAWAAIPITSTYVISNINIGILYLFAVSSFGVYGVIIAGWASNSKYPFLGALRSAAQMISYEVSIGFVIITVLICVGSLNLIDSRKSKRPMVCYPTFANVYRIYISALAETNRLPFDLPEDEATLVAGFLQNIHLYHLVYFFLAEYANMILMSSLTVILFSGGWYPPLDIFPLNAVPGVIWFALKVFFDFICFLWVRATFPRYRYDQLMRLG